MASFRLTTCAAALGVALIVGGPVQAGPLGVVDDYDVAGLTEYDFYKVLDQGDGTTNVSFSDAGGSLAVSSTGTSGAEQVLLFRNDGATLAAGEELQISGPAAINGANDLGLAIGATPTGLANGVAGDNRSAADFVFVSYRSPTQLNNRGFIGGTEFSQAQEFGVNADKLFIARLDNDDMEIGWYDGDMRNVMRTLTPASTDIFDRVGFYADLRNDGNSASGLDDLTVVPEPGSLAIAGFSVALSLAVIRRRVK